LKTFRPFWNFKSFPAVPHSMVFTSFHLPNWRYVIWSVFKVVYFWIFLLIWLGLELGVRVRG
jgi:hypothetical protein